MLNVTAKLISEMFGFASVNQRDTHVMLFGQVNKSVIGL